MVYIYIGNLLCVWDYDAYNAVYIGNLLGFKTVTPKNAVYKE